MVTRTFSAEMRRAIVCKTTAQIDIPDFVTDPEDVSRFVAAFLTNAPEGVALEWEQTEAGVGHLFNIQEVKSETRQAIEGGCKHKQLERLVGPEGSIATYKCLDCGAYRNL